MVFQACGGEARSPAGAGDGRPITAAHSTPLSTYWGVLAQVQQQAAAFGGIFKAGLPGEPPILYVYGLLLSFLLFFSFFFSFFFFFCSIILLHYNGLRSLYDWHIEGHSSEHSLWICQASKLHREP